MSMDDLFLRRAVVLASALVYWGGVWFQARRVRKRIGRSPNLKPRGLKERLLWFGWFLIVSGWIALPLMVQPGVETAWVRPVPGLLGVGGLMAGLILILAGYAGTLWCYSAMGDHWRIMVDRRNKGALVTGGPYRVVRHPIYLFQILMLVGVLVLLPAGLPLLLLLVHVGCTLVKAWDEEAYLLDTHGEPYREYMARTGMLWPPLGRPPRISGD